MAKLAQKDQLYCSSCYYKYSKWQGRCDGCGEWNTIVQTAIRSSNTAQFNQTKLISLADASHKAAERFPTGIAELDTVLGGGFVFGSVSLLGGEPGIGKSTLTMQIAQAAAKQNQRILYVTGEESLDQIVLRAERLGEKHKNVFLLSEIDIDRICEFIVKEKPDIVLIDSIQVMIDPCLQALAGSVSQVRSCADKFIRVIKQSTSIGLMIGHITRDGHLAGPKVLEHMVDCIFYLEGDHQRGFRLLRSYKNRFSSTDDIGLFAMEQQGLKAIDDSGHFFVDFNAMQLPGSVIAAVEHGQRCLLVEVQALVVNAGQGPPKRNFVGVDTNRVHLLIATLEKICGIPLSGKDIFINIVGGIKIVEPGLDLAICMAIISSVKNQRLDHKMGVMGEVGLTGEIRAISQFKQRLYALQRIDITHCLIPARNTEPIDSKQESTIIKIPHLSDIIARFKR